MKSENRSAAFLRKRKMMLVLPLLVIPFLTMAFWALGGGSGSAARASGREKGLNLNLPAANVKAENDEGKLSFYDRAQKDSAKRKEWMENDPYYRNLPDSAFEPPAKLQDVSTSTAKYHPLNTTPFSSGVQAPADKLMQKLSTLQKQLDKPAGKTSVETSMKSAPSADNFHLPSQQLQSMMQETSAGGEDPEIGQLETTLDKILDIQHPERVKERLKEKSSQNKKQVFVVTDYKPEVEITVLGGSKGRDGSTDRHNAFYDEKNSTTINSVDANAVAAAIHETQTITSGSTVKLRLLANVLVGGRQVPRGSFLFGTASLEGERLNISIPAIRYNNNLLPISLSVYDLDGLAGIHVPGTLTSDVARQSADQSLGNHGLMTLDPSLKAQAASEGIRAAKSLLSKKVKQVKITLKAGYQVLLKDANSEE